MTKITQFDNPNDIENMDNLKIKVSTGNLSPKIYANGRNQLEVEITAKATKKVGDEDKPLHFSKDTWIGILNLRYAQSDSKLNRKGNSGWCFTGDKNDYCGEVGVNSASKTSCFSVNDEGTVIICMYVYANLTKGETERIAVSVDTNNGKHFTTADNSTSIDTMSVTVNALPKIDYSLRQNIKLDGMPKSIDDFSKIVSNMAVRRSLNDPEESVWYVGVSSKKRFTIKPALVEYGYAFKLISPIRNNANLSSCNFPDNIKPDMIRGTGGANFDAQFIFVNQKTYGLSSNSKINVHDNSSARGYLYHYEIGVNDTRHYWEKNLDDGSITVDICNHRIPWPDIIKYEWEDQGKLIKLNVIDNYGNGGVVTIEAPNNEHLWPILYVNGE
ncbi:hypothetical protein [Wolbachia endosymbiont (group B) of Camptogramma bilineatum]|uniref:hypothetical protein n=2 Tax=Wolbachia endosymbiont (group B) of Camptogramma bilineatum TaxID=2953991 RepID=UPI00222F1028|nr:hypothetical protein [Wolbachia endosymbiont (group B) of Camptogramma bilineatum]